MDIVSPGDQLPLEDSSVDFVISSHVIEHFPDPIKALSEWYRVVKPGGYLYIIAPHKERTFDKERPRTTLAELIERHETGKQPITLNEHCSVWITEDFVELIHWLGWNILHVQDTDDKVGNGFTIVVGVEKGNAPRLNVAASVAKRTVSPLQPGMGESTEIHPKRPSLSGSLLRQRRSGSIEQAAKRKRAIAPRDRRFDRREANAEGHRPRSRLGARHDDRDAEQ